MAVTISGMLSRALVTAMVGRMSTPSAISSREDLADAVAPRVERDDLAGLRPLRMRTDLSRRVRVVQVGPGQRVERPGGHRQRAVERIGAAMGADDVAVRRVRHRADDRAALAGIRQRPSGSASWRTAALGSGWDVRRIWVERLGEFMNGGFRTGTESSPGPRCGSCREPPDVPGNLIQSTSGVNTRQCSGFRRLDAGSCRARDPCDMAEETSLLDEAYPQ